MNILTEKDIKNSANVQLIHDSIFFLVQKRFNLNPYFSMKSFSINDKNECNFSINIKVTSQCLKKKDAARQKFLNKKEKKYPAVFKAKPIDMI